MNAHQDSTAARDEGHQTETHGWDSELVPDGSGRVSEPVDDCPVEIALAAISGRWTTLVLRELLHGQRSFGELRAALPRLRAKVLTDRLTEAVRRGLVEREVHRAFPMRVTYRLTPAGRALRPLLISLYRAGTELAALAQATR